MDRVIDHLIWTAASFNDFNPATPYLRRCPLQQYQLDWQSIKVSSRFVTIDQQRGGGESPNMDTIRHLAQLASSQAKNRLR